MVYGETDLPAATRAWHAERVEPERLDAEIRSALHKAARHRPLSDADALALFRAEGPALEALCEVADDLRREAVGDEITYVVNRNINFTNVCYVGCRFCAFAQREIDPESYTLTLGEVAERAREAEAWGATEVCMQGGIHPDLPGTFYFDLLDAVKAVTPDIHIHAFSPMEILNGATRLGISFREFLSECKAHGLGTIPGTAAEILDDDVRWVLTKGKLPADTWEEIVRTAHDLGIRSSSTIMYGHVDAPPHWVFHIRRIADIQRDTGGFTEFVPLSFVHQNAPIYLAGKARAGATGDEDRRMHAVARILLDGVIHNVQVSWVKLGVDASLTDPERRSERFRRHLDGGNDQPHGRRRVGDPHGAARVRRCDPFDRAHRRLNAPQRTDGCRATVPRAPAKRLRPHSSRRSTTERARTAGICVNLIDDIRQSP